MAEGRALRLIAEDSADLEVISSAVQDAVLKAENLKFIMMRISLHCHFLISLLSDQQEFSQNETYLFDG